MGLSVGGIFFMNIDEHTIEVDDRSERTKAKIVVRMIYYISEDMQELGLGECSQLIRFIADVVRIKYKIQDSEALLTYN